MSAAGERGSAMSNMAVQQRRVTHLTGMTVKNAEGQDLGDIEDFVIDVPNGQLVYTVISFGGVAGIGERYAAVPARVVNLQPRNNMAVLNATRQNLESVAFKPSEFPDMSSREYTQRIYQMFHAEPYGAPLGYIPSEEQRAASEKAWGPEGSFGKNFNASNVKTIKGTVQTLGVFQPEGAAPGISSGLRLRVKTEDGNLVTVYAGPIWYAEQQNFFLMPGDEIAVTGAETKTGPRNVIVASELRKGSQALQLRDKSGKPLWRLESRGMPPGQRVSPQEPRPGTTPPGRPQRGQTRPQPQ
jgi:sporulation protein YlmC with PRC-barrel domain